jgi:hypothetical protein
MKHAKGEIVRAIVLSLILTSGIGYALADWVAPTSAPPTGNTPPPVNIGGATQVKNGNFSLGAGYTLAATSGSFGGVAVGKTAPAAGVALDVVGNAVIGKATLNTLQLGNKWSIKATGDFETNDYWIRLMNAAGTGYYGGFAANELYSVGASHASQFCFNGTGVCFSSLPHLDITQVSNLWSGGDDLDGSRANPYMCPDGYVVTGITWYELSDSDGHDSDAGDNITVRCTKLAVS